MALAEGAARDGRRPGPRSRTARRFGDHVGVEDGRIVAALRRVEAIAEPLSRRSRTSRARSRQSMRAPHDMSATARRSSMPCSWSAWSWVMSTPSSRPLRASSSCSRMSGEVSTSTAVSPAADLRRTSSEQRRRRFLGLAGSQAPQIARRRPRRPGAARRRRSRSPELSTSSRVGHVRPRCASVKRRKKLSVVALGQFVRR